MIPPEETVGGEDPGFRSTIEPTRDGDERFMEQYYVYSSLVRSRLIKWRTIVEIAR